MDYNSYKLQERSCDVEESTLLLGYSGPLVVVDFDLTSIEMPL